MLEIADAVKAVLVIGTEIPFTDHKGSGDEGGLGLILVDEQPYATLVAIDDDGQDQMNVSATLKYVAEW